MGIQLEGNATGVGIQLNGNGTGFECNRRGMQPDGNAIQLCTHTIAISNKSQKNQNDQMKVSFSGRGLINSSVIYNSFGLEIVVFLDQNIGSTFLDPVILAKSL